MNAVNFFQNASSPTFMLRFFSYYTHIIPGESHIWLVLGLAIWAIFGDLATSRKNGLAYKEAVTSQSFY